MNLTPFCVSSASPRTSFGPWCTFVRATEASAGLRLTEATATLPPGNMLGAEGLLCGPTCKSVVLKALLLVTWLLISYTFAFKKEKGLGSREGK